MSEDRGWNGVEMDMGGGEERGERQSDGQGGDRVCVCVCVRLLDEAMEGVNPFLHHYLVSATALTLISLRAARPARSLPHPSIYRSTPDAPPHRHHPSLPPHLFSPPSLLLPLLPPSLSLSFLQRFPHFLCLSLVLRFIFVSVEID